MARSLFSGRPGDFIALPPSTTSGTVKVAANVVATGTAWTAQTGGTQLTDLLSVAGAGITGLSTDADGYLVPFQGPDGVARLWVDFGGPRRLLEAQVLTSAILTDASATGLSLLKAANVAAAQAALNVPDASTVLTPISGAYASRGVVLPVAGAWPPRPSASASDSFIFLGPLTLSPPPAVTSGTAGMWPQDICIRA